MDCVGGSNSEMGNHIDLINETLDVCNQKNSMKSATESASYSNGQEQKINNSEEEGKTAALFSAFDGYDEQKDGNNGTLEHTSINHSSRLSCKQLKDKLKNTVSNCSTSSNSISETTENECSHKLPLNDSTNHVRKNFGDNVECSKVMPNICNNHNETEYPGTTSSDATSSLIASDFVPSKDKIFSPSRTEASSNAKIDKDVEIIAVYDSSANINICNSNNNTVENNCRRKVRRASSSGSHKVHSEMEVDKNKGNTLKIKHNSTSKPQSFSSERSVVSKPNGAKSSVSKVCKKPLIDNITPNSSNHSVDKDYIQNTDARVQKNKHKEKSPDLSHKSKSSDPPTKEIITNNEESTTGIKKKSKGSFNQNKVDLNTHGNSGRCGNSNLKDDNSTHSEKSGIKNLTSSSSTALDSKMNRKLKRNAATIVNDNERKESNTSSSCSEHKRLKQSITLQKQKSDLCITLKLSSVKKRQQKKDVIKNIINEVISKGSGPIKVSNANGTQTITRNEEWSVNREETCTSISRWDHTTKLSDTKKVSQTSKLLEKNRCITLREGVGRHNSRHKDPNLHTEAAEKPLKSVIIPRSILSSPSKKQCRNGEVSNSSQLSVSKHKNSADCVMLSKSNHSQIKLREKITQSIKEKVKQSADLNGTPNSDSKQVSSHVTSSHVVEIKSKVCKNVSVVSAESDVATDGSEHSDKIDERTDKCSSKNISRKSRHPLNADQISNSVSKHHDQVNETYSSLRVSEIRNTEDKIRLTLSRCITSPHQNKQVKSDSVNIVPKYSSTSNQLPKSASKPEQIKQMCHMTKTSEVKVKDDKKYYLSSESDGDSSKNTLQTSVSLQTQAKISITEECSAMKHHMYCSQTTEIESEDCNKVSNDDKNATTTTIQSKLNCNSMQKKSRKVSVSEHSLHSKHHAHMSEPSNVSQVLKVDEKDKDFSNSSSSVDDSSDSSFQTRPSTNMVKRKLAFLTAAHPVQNSEQQNHSSKIFSSQIAEVQTKISKKVCDISSRNSSFPTKTLHPSMLNNMQKIMNHTTTSANGTNSIRKNPDNVKIIFVPLSPNDMNSVNSLKHKLNLVTSRSKLRKQNCLENLLQKKNVDFIRNYSTHSDQAKDVEKICETNRDSASCHNAPPKVIVENIYGSNCVTPLQFNSQVDRPKVVVEKNPYLCLGLNEVSALKYSDDDDEDVFNTDVPDSSSSMDQGVVEHRKRFRSLSFEAATKRSKLQCKKEERSKVSIAAKEKSLVASKEKSSVASKEKISIASTEKCLVASKEKCLVPSKEKCLVPSKEKSLDASKETSARVRQNSPESHVSERGTCFKDIPCIAAEIEESPDEFLYILYSILFNGQALGSKALAKIKKNILSFRGFSFSEESVKYQILRKRLKRLHFKALSDIENMFFGTCLVDRSGVHEKVLNFLMNPTREVAEALRKTRARRMPQVSEEHKKLKLQLLEGDDEFPKVRIKRLTQEKIESYLRLVDSDLTFQEQSQSLLDLDFNENPDDKKEMSTASTTIEKEITSKNAVIMDVSSPTKKNEIPRLGRSLMSFTDVAADINNASEPIVSLIHVLLFGIDGDIATRKQNILEFRGVPTDHKFDFKTRKKFLHKISTCDLKKVCKVLHLKLENQNKGSMISGLLQFIKFPCEVFLKKMTTKDGTYKSTKRKSSSSSSRPFGKRSSNSEITPTKKLPIGNASSPDTSSDTSFSPYPTLSLSSESNASMGSVFNNSTGELMLKDSPPIRIYKTSAASDLLEVKSPVGRPLESFETIRFNVECATPNDLSELYDILFVKPCDSYEIHQKILQFRGFDFSENSMEYHFRKTLISYMNIESIEKIAKFLNLIDDYTHMHKNELADQILKFLVGLKDEKAGTGSNSPAKRTNIVRLREKAENPLSSPPLNESQVALQPFKFKSGASSPLPSFSTECYQLTRRMNADVSSSSEDETESSVPLISFANHPSDSRLKKDIKEILFIKGFNITMKELVASIYARYPEFDLRYRSNFIKSKARHILSNLPRS